MDDRCELLRTQAMTHVLGALGAATVQAYGHDHSAAGVYLDTNDRATATTYWTVGEDGQRYRYDVVVRVELERTAVGRAGR